MALGGLVFNTGKSNTSQLGLRSFLRHMNVKELEDPVFSPVAAETQGLQTDGDMHDAYMESVRSVNELGLNMAAQGIDVFNPDQRNPQSVKAARLFQRFMSDANSQLAALKTGQDMAALRAQLRLNSGVIDTSKGLPTDRPATASDLDSLYNLTTFEKPADDYVDTVNSQYAKQYQTDGQRALAEGKITEAKERFLELKQQFIEQGLPEHLANDIIQSRIPKFGQATLDEGFETTQALKRAQANHFNKKEEEVTKTATFRKNLIFKILNDDPVALASIIDGEFIQAASPEISPTGERVLKVKLKFKPVPVKIPWTEGALNNLLDIKNGAEKERVTLEELKSIPDIVGEEAEKIIADIKRRRIENQGPKAPPSQDDRKSIL